MTSSGGVLDETSSLVDQLLRQYLSCSLCHERYNDPRLLPCLHSFCSRCLNSYIPAHSLSATCPVCRHQSILPRDGVTALSTNRVLARLVNAIEMTATSSSPRPHPQVITSLLVCANHDGEPLAYYCSDCETAVCCKCTGEEGVEGEHRPPHRTGLLAEAVDVHRQSLRALVTDVREQLPLMTSALTAIRDVSDRLDQRYNETRAHIDDSFEMLARALTGRRDALLAELDALHAGKRATLVTQVAIGDDVISTVRGSCDFTCDVVEHGSDTEVLLLRKAMTSLCLTSLCDATTRIVPEENDFIEFDDSEMLPTSSVVYKCLLSLGSLRSNSAVAMETTGHGIGLKRCWVNRPAKIAITSRDRHGEQVKVGGAAVSARVYGCLPSVTSVPSVTSLTLGGTATSSDGFSIVNGDHDDPTTTGSVASTIPEVKDIGDGTYEISYTVREPGTYELEIKLHGALIRGSPFRIKAHRETDSMERMKSGAEMSGGSTSGSASRIPSSKQRGTNRPSSSRSHGSANRKSNPIDDDLILKIGVKGRNRGEFLNPQGVTCHDDRIIIADSNSQCVQVFSTSDNESESGTTGNGNCVLRFGTKGRQAGQMQRPTGVAVTVNGNYLIADYDNRCVNVHGPDGRYINKIGGGKLLGPKGVCVDREGHIIVVDNKASTVFVYTSNGRLLHKFGSRGNEERHLAGPHYCAVTHNNDIIVTDFHNHCVKVFNVEGTFRYQFGSSGEGNGQFNSPTGVAVDHLGNIFVADWGNSRIQMFDSHGSFLSYVNTSADPLYGPQGLAVMEDGRIVVADSGNHCVKIYRHLIQETPTDAILHGTT